MPAAMPTAHELHFFLVAAGMMSKSSLTDAELLLDLSGAAAAGVEDFERATHWEPFLVAKDGAGAPVDTTLRFDPWQVIYPPNGLPMLDLDGGVVGTPTSVIVGVDGANPGSTLTADADYFLCPAKAPVKGKPFTYIEFYRTWGGAGGLGSLGLAVPQSIRITGKAGYSLTVPDDVFQAVLRRAAIRVAPQISAALSGGLLSWSEADGTKEQYGEAPFLATWAAWDTEANRTEKRYRRVI